MAVSPDPPPSPIDALRSVFGGAAVAGDRPSLRWMLAAVLVLGCVVLFLRRPEGLLAARFFAEDGAVFFRDAFQLPLHRSALLPHAGYLNLLPRLLAEAALLLPLRYVPLGFNLSALLVAAGALSWIALPGFRHLIPSDRIRLGLAAVLWVAPNQEALMKLSYVQWYVLLWVSLCAFMRWPRSVAGRFALAAGCGVALLTSPVAVVLLPLWVLRAWSAADRWERRFGVAMAAITIAACAGNLALPYTAPFPVPDVSVPLVRILHGLLNGLAYKVVCSLPGSSAAVVLASWGWWAVCGASSLLAGATFWVYLRQRLETRLLGLALLWLIVGSVACFVIRPQFLEDFALGRNLALHDRYFFLGSCLGYVALFRLLAKSTAGLPAALRTGPPLAALFAVVIALQLPTFGYRWTPRDDGWPSAAARIGREQAEANRTGVPQRARIAINPPGWWIELVIEPAAAADAAPR